LRKEKDAISLTTKEKKIRGICRKPKRREIEDWRGKSGTKLKNAKKKEGKTLSSRVEGGKGDQHGLGEREAFHLRAGEKKK